MVEIKIEKKKAFAEEEGREVGYAAFSSSSNFWIIDHTEVDDAYNGQGIGKKLVDKVAEEARKEGKKLMATCPFALAMFKKYPEEYEDVLYK